MVSFVAPSGTGKTSMLQSVIGRLSERGYRVAAVKHDAHRIELDTEGKDSWRLRHSGSADTLLVGRNQILWMGEDDTEFDLSALTTLFCSKADIVLVEGYRSAGLDTVRVHRPEKQDPTWKIPESTNVIATVHPDDVDTVVNVLIERYLDAR